MQIVTSRPGQSTMAFMAPRYKFPDPGDRSFNAPAVMCPAPRVLALYNQDSGDKAQRIAKKVKQWFYTTALERGWAHVWWFPDVANGYTSGCVMAIQAVELTVSAAYASDQGDDAIDVPVVEPSLLNE